MPKELPTIKAGKLIEELSKFPADADITFSGLTFYRCKDRGSHVQIEFDEQVYLDKHGRVVVENHEE